MKNVFFFLILVIVDTLFKLFFHPGLCKVEFTHADVEVFSRFLMLLFIHPPELPFATRVSLGLLGQAVLTIF